ncbi:MAG: SDR family NAD(P)-dependent oxidoreductase [Myxococcales bacterium]|nr:SDR family NAD(P)-dependent oxidoreductase [Myxococcales bacterium]
MKQLRDRVAVVTGAASGIGRALAVALANKGCDVALVDVDEEGLRETAARVATSGRKVSSHVLSVADRSAMEALPEQVVAEHGRVHIVVNNAGVAVDMTFEEMSMDDLDWIVGVNFWGVVHGCKFFLPWLQREDEAHIVNVSSLFGIIAVPRNSAYCATKFAVRGLTESIWSEISKQGIGLSTVHPGGIQTNIVRSARTAAGADKDELVDAFDRLARTSPEKAAARIVRGIEKNQLRVRIAPETYLLDWLKRLFPTGIQTFIRARAQDVPGSR